MGVEQKLRTLRAENVRHHPTKDIRKPLSPELEEYCSQAEDVIGDSAKFLETSGIKLALFEFNQDMLSGLGHVGTGYGYLYSGSGEVESLAYFSQVFLRWRKAPGEPFYAIVVSTEGNLMETIETEDGDEDHRKSLNIKFFRSTYPKSVGKRVGPIIRFGRPFDIYDPLGDSEQDYDDEGVDTNRLAELEEIEEVVGPRDIYRNWIDANIANFISYSRRVLDEDPIVRETA